MGEHRAPVDQYIARSAPFAHPILEHLRDLVHATCPEVRESIKWSMPFFTRGDHLICNMAAFRAHCSFGFWDRRMTPLLSERGVLSGNAMGSLGRIRTLGDLPDDAILSSLLACARDFALQERKGRLVVALQPRPALEPPPDLLGALALRPGATENFAAMSPSSRREYIEWVLESKREETRERRIRETADRVAEGKTRNYEYEARAREARGA